MDHAARETNRTNWDARVPVHIGSELYIDFSPASIEQARKLAERMDLQATFIEAEVQTLDLGRVFDVVFASAGVLCWIEDVERWMQVAAKHLAPGGVFYLFDGHPLAEAFEGDYAEELDLIPNYGYFDTSGIRYEDGYTYAGEAQLEQPVNYQWRHPLSQIIQAAINAGLRLEFVHEHPHSYYQRYKFSVRDGDYWRIPGDPIPLTYSIRASK